MTATTDVLTREEMQAGFDALIKRVAELAAEREAAMQMASQATKDLVRVRDEHAAQLLVRDRLIESLRIGRETDAATNRRLTAHVRELALANEELQRRLDEAQQKPEPKPVRRSFWSARGGNQF